MTKRTTRKTRPAAKTEHRDAELLRALVSAFVRYPDDIEIEHRDQGANWMLRLRVHAEDQSRCVGFSGQHVRAIQAIFRFIGARDSAKELKVALLEPERGRQEQLDGLSPYRVPKRGEWDVQAVVDLLRAVLERILAKEFEIAVVCSGDTAADTTSLDVTVDDSEREIMETADKKAGILHSIRPIFNAIGKVNGVQLFVTVPEPLPEALKR